MKRANGSGAGALARAIALLAWLAFAAPGLAGTLSGVVNVNTATVAELTLLPGIGDARASAIVALRAKKKGFRKLEDLLEVKGIGEVSLRRLRPFLTLEGKSTLAAS